MQRLHSESKPVFKNFHPEENDYCGIYSYGGVNIGKVTALNTRDQEDQIVAAVHKVKGFHPLNKI